MVLTSAPTYVATRESLKVLSPQDLTPVRFLGAAVVLGIFLLFRRQRLALTRGDVPRMLLVGLLGYAGYGLLLNLGQATVPAGTTSLLLNISPVFAFILSYLILKERTTRLGYAGIVMAVAGVAVITLADRGAVGFNRDAMYIVAAALVLSVFLIVQQPLFKRIPPVEVVFWGSVIGGLATLPTATFKVDPARFSPTFWTGLVVLVVVSTAVAYAFWNISLARTSVAEGGALLYVVPVLSLLLGWGLLAEVPTVGSLIGGAAALGGVILLSRATPPASEMKELRLVP
ncbi:DMT family transporter [Arthrobacter sp. ISL-5]|uniref:DMT family transporter n=1 Tax=Arthrobacter sp. ISL-5 TaxID=2819111 RepID=UPI001BE5E4A3|nr:DMT family transporter [Arthrobacter sp. ISL-5]MBT2554511.1 DMT family transporter [Arthrobacter sp. ISL-5]